MDFPNIYYITSQGFSVIPNDGSQQDRAMSGKLHIRRLWDKTRYTIQFTLVDMSATDILATLQFYESYKFETVTWTDPFTGRVFDVLMTQPPQPGGYNGKKATLTVYMEGVVADG